MARLTLELFGSFRVSLNGRPIAGLFRSEKERALLAYLAVEAGRPYSREALAEFFWPEKPMGMARTNLRQALAGCRKALGDKESGEPFCLVSDQTIQFNPNSSYWLDVNAYEGLFRSVLIHQHPNVDACEACVDSLREAIRLYKGSFLDDFYHVDSLEYKEWLACHREQYFRYMLTALHKIARFHENRGNFEEATEFIKRQVNLDPLDESPLRKLMQLLALSGKRNSALEQYNLSKTILARELGVEPSPETQEVYQQIRSGKVGVFSPSRAPIPKSRGEMTAFFDREQELERFSRCVVNPVCRLMTLVGMPGIGKTRLALKIAAQHEADFKDGVYILQTDQVQSAEELVPALAGVLGLHPETLQGLQARLFEHMKEMNALILIDGFERFLPKTDLLLELLHRSPGLKILVASRERLNYQAACLFDIGGLPFPADGAVDAPEKYPAFNLFINRAGNIRPGFKATERNTPDILEICKQVEGSPLAIELAAASLRDSSSSDIARSLEKSIHILNTTLKDIPEKHRSIWNALHQSWEQLSPVEKDQYLKLKALAGRFSSEDAFELAGVSIDLLSLFVEKCFLNKDLLGNYHMPSLFRLYLNDLERMGDHLKGKQADIQVDLSQYTDGLTGLAAKELFWDRLSHTLAISKRKKQLFALMLIDLKCIIRHKLLLSIEKQTVQKMIAGRLRNCLRLSDTIARYSQEEIVLIIEDLPDYRSSEVVVQKVLSVLTEEYEVGTNLYQLPVRIGISIFPQDGDTASLLLSNAAQARDKLESGTFGRAYFSPSP